VSVLQSDCEKPVWNGGVLRSPRRMRHAAGESVKIRPPHSPGFSASPARSQSGPSDVLRMIRSPYSYNLSFLKKEEVMMVVSRSSTA
jgi:hypothetical protein